MSSQNSIQLSVLGGGGEVGANCFQLAIAGQHILLDSGTHPKKDGRSALPEFGMLGRAPEALLVTHAHQDHCGSIPYLMKEYPGVKAHATFPTVRIIDRMLHNSVSVMGLLARERGIKDYPLYEHEDVEYAMQRFQGHEFNRPFKLPLSVPVHASFHRAGHVLGSASILIKAPGHTIYYTGDLCETRQELIDGLQPLPEDEQVDTLIIESTHGANDLGGAVSYQEEIYRLGTEVAKVLEAGGTVLIPSFALGRTQEVLNFISRLQEEGVVPEVPVYASGLGRAVYELYNKFTDYMLPEATLRPLDKFKRIGNVWKPGVVKKLISEPAIIVATSGMMLENTPSALIAEEMVQGENHGIFFVGYLDSETLGYRLTEADSGDELMFGLDRPTVPVTLENVQRFSFSAHAPRTALQGVIEHIKPKNVVFVHGDGDAIDWMNANTGNGYNNYAPAIGQTITLES
jgi:Cft2 family RNA processing exonuclease